LRELEISIDELSRLEHWCLLRVIGRKSPTPRLSWDQRQTNFLLAHGQLWSLRICSFVCRRFAYRGTARLWSIWQNVPPRERT